LVQQQVAAAVALIIGREIDSNEPLMDAGLDSLAMTEVASAISNSVGVQLPQTIAFDYPSIAAISSFIVSQQNPAGAQGAGEPQFGSAGYLPPLAVQGEDRRTAVVGMGMRLPRTITDNQALWEMLVTGGDAITRVPADRWDIDLTTSAGVVGRRRDPEHESYSRHGSFVEGIELFDNAFFSVSAKDAAEIDPQQRVLVQVCAEALHLSGLDRRSMRNSNTACIIGICNNDYDLYLRQEAVGLMLSGGSTKAIADKVGRVAYSTYAFAANRVSHTLALVGPSLSVDTASASALVATHMATLEARRLGAGARAMSGGVNLILHPALTDLHTARKMFPKDGRCKTFDASADGFERGEGSAAVVQRPLLEATADSDAILAVVRGSTTIHKGGGASLRAMRGPAIQQKVRIALQDAGMQPHDLRYIEASGLGEPYGDAVEVGAYQAVFQPGRARDSPLIFGSVHTNIGHLDGASGIAAFAKVVLLTQQQAVPPIVHFRQLHPLVTGRKSGVEQATKMGHTYTAEVNVAGFPALFPMAASPMAATSGTNGCPAGVSAFGFGGSMAHVIVDCTPTRDVVRPPLRYTRAVAFPWKTPPEENMSAKLQEGGEMALSYLESVIRASLEPSLPPDMELTRSVDFFEAGLTPPSALGVCAELRERLEVAVDADMLAANPTISRLAVAVLHKAVVSRAAAPFSLPQIVRAYMNTQVSRQVLDPRRSMLPNPARNPGRVIIVLAGPRSGSTLLQLVLNAHPGLYAGQELYLLPYFTMPERRSRMDSGLGVRGFIFEGLRKTVMELRGCSVAQADELLEEMAELNTQDVYRVLQAWAGPRILVDKTPTYGWSVETLRRAEALFEEVQYIHLHRHPYATISSMAAEAVQRDYVAKAAGDSLPPGWEGQLDAALWDESEALWAQCNANIQDFCRSLPPERCTRLAYEDLLAKPAVACRRLCAFLRLPYHAGMTTPYTADNLATFQPAVEGGMGAGDPKLRNNKQIDARMADAWRKVSVPRPLTSFAAHVALGLGYALPAWKEPALRLGAPAELERLNACTARGPPLVLLHGASGTVSQLRALAAALPVPVFGLRMTEAARERGGSWAKLAAHYCRALDSLGLPPAVRIATMDGCGVALAQALARCLGGGGGVAGPILLVGGGEEQLPGRISQAQAHARALWALAQEGGWLGGRSPPDRAQLLAALDGCANADDKLELMASCAKPDDMPLSDWDVLAGGVINSVLHMLRLSVKTARGGGLTVLRVGGSESEVAAALREPAISCRS